LRIDYRTDYILMVAETYHREVDLEQAIRRLGMLGSTPPADMVYQAILFARKAGYTDGDQALMQALLSALQAGSPIQGETPAP
jgi:hypothetical protein